MRNRYAMLAALAAGVTLLAGCNATAAPEAATEAPEAAVESAMPAETEVDYGDLDLSDPYDLTTAYLESLSQGNLAKVEGLMSEGVFSVVASEYLESAEEFISPDFMVGVDADPAWDQAEVDGVWRVPVIFELGGQEFDSSVEIDTTNQKIKTTMGSSPSILWGDWDATTGEAVGSRNPRDGSPIDAGFTIGGKPVGPESLSGQQSIELLPAVYQFAAFENVFIPRSFNDGGDGLFRAGFMDQDGGYWVDVYLYPTP